jgi:GntR family transcriptional regulator, transcriptional repressor for pyruvate dehydrogenase complex
VTEIGEVVEYTLLQRVPTLSDRVTASVLEMITSSALVPGDRLPSVRELGTQFGVSKTVVREALRSLAAKGVLDVRSGSGAVVARVGPETASEVIRLYVQSARDGSDAADRIDYEQLDDIRDMLETRIARIAAQRAQEEDLAGLRAIHEEMAAAGKDKELASQLDVAFHRAIGVATHNPLYLVLMDSIEPVLMEIRLQTLGVPGRPARALQAHAKILARIEAGDAEGAEQAMREHLADAREIWRKARRRKGTGQEG